MSYKITVGDGLFWDSMSEYLKGLEHPKQLPKFYTALEISTKFSGLVSELRILELAESGILPHVTFDGGPPMFILRFAKQWILENLMVVRDGRHLHRSIVIFDGDKSSATETIPESIRQLSGHLYDFGGIPSYPPSVYFLIRDEKIVYVGQSIMLGSRIESHLRYKKFNRVLFLPWPKHELEALERKLILAIMPEYNKEAFLKKAKKDGVPPDVGMISELASQLDKPSGID